MNRGATQQCNMSPCVYAVYWLPPASSAFLLARKCNWLAEKMLITCVMRHARLQKLQRFRRKMPFYSFLILWPKLKFVNFNSQMKVNLSGFQLIPNCGNMRFRPAIFIWFLFAQFFFKLYQNGGIQKLNACCFQLLKNYFHTINIECARPLQSSITCFIHPVSLVPVIIHSVH